MKTTWFKDTSKKEDKEARRQVVLSAEQAFKVLTEILDDKIRIKEGERNAPDRFELPAYPFYQADASGYIRALKEVQSLIDLQE